MKFRLNIELTRIKSITFENWIFDPKKKKNNNGVLFLTRQEEGKIWNKIWKEEKEKDKGAKTRGGKVAAAGHWGRLESTKNPRNRSFCLAEDRDYACVSSPRTCFPFRLVFARTCILPRTEVTRSLLASTTKRRNIATHSFRCSIQFQPYRLYFSFPFSFFLTRKL